MKQLSQLQETILCLLAANPEGLRHCQICTKLRQTGDTHRRETIQNNLTKLLEVKKVGYSEKYVSTHRRYQKQHNLTRKHYHLLNQIEAAC